MGKSGRRDGPATAFVWRWYYHLLSLAFWGVAVVPLVLLKENRRWQAWTILIPLGVIVVLCQMLASLSTTGSAGAEGLRTFIVTLVTAWAAVWLVGFSLAGRHRSLAFAAAFGVMLAVGLLSYLCNFGAVTLESLAPLSIYYIMLALGLLAPMSLSGWCCRKVYSPGRFMLWLFAWMLLTPAAAMVVLFGGMALSTGVTTGPFALVHLLIMVPFMTLAGGAYGVALCISINLPFMLLVFRNSFYRERFYKVFGLQPAPDSVAEGAAIVETV